MRLAAALAVALALATAVAPPGADAVLKMLVKNDGSVQTIRLSESSLDGTPAVRSIKGGGTRIYIIDQLTSSIATPPILPRVRSVVGRRVVSNEILVGPRGCDYATNPELAVEHSNCVKNTVEQRVNRERLNELWYLPSKGRNVDECFSRGGDEHSCVGPPLILLDNVDPFVPRTYSERDLLMARGVAVQTASGWLGAIPSLVHVDMILPNLFIGTVCDVNGDTFEAQYRTFHYDAYSRMITDAWIVFEPDGIYQRARRLILRRWPDAESRSFRAELATVTGSGLNEGYFVVTHTSVAVFTPASNLERWADMLPIGTAIIMTAVATNYTCNITLSIVSAPNPPQLREPEVVTDRTYMKSKIVNPHLLERVSCNYAVGGYTSDLQLKYAYTPEGALRGGYARYVTADSPHLPIFVPPDSRYDAYADDCDKVYPLASSFLGFGLDGTGTGDDRSLYQRMVPSEHRCFAPLLVAQLINDAIVVEERENQCTMLGLSCATLTCDVCAGRLTTALCKKDFLPFAGRCYYKFDPTKELGSRVILGESNAACAAVDPELGAQVTAAAAPDIYLKAWLQKHFVHWKKRGVGYPYRLTSVGGDVCDGYDYAVVDEADPTQDVATVTKILCNDKAFPLCSYPFKAYEVVDRYTAHAPETIKLLRDGNKDGGAWTGEEAQCVCYNGSGGKICQQPTCGRPVVESADVTISINNVITAFFTACYTGQRGRCQDGQPRDCWCEDGSTPDATLMPSTSLNALFARFPCACPASKRKDAMIVQQINNETFSSAHVRAACGGIENGVCYVDSVINEGRCVCQRRRDTNPDALEVDEPSMGGPACLARVAKVPPNGYALNPPNIVQEACNARGTICGGGNRAEVCYDPETNDGIDGCVCDAGLTGEACTCPAPLDLADKIPTQTTLDNRAFVDLGLPKVVTVVKVAPRKTFTINGGVDSSCDELAVGLSDAPQSVVRVVCTPRPGNDASLWNCAPGTGRYRFVVVDTTQLEPRCDVFVYSDYHEPCGDFGKTNPTAGAFSNNEINRRFGQTIEPQNVITFAASGCTNSECLCSPNYSGKLCNAGVSAIGENADGKLVSFVCGENLLPPRGKYDHKTGACVGNDITTSDTTGEAGVVKGYFTGDASEFFMMYVRDRNTHMMCAGRGQPEPVVMPWGTCIDDLEDFESDPLYTPFVRVPGSPPVSGEFIALSRSSTFFQRYDHGEGDLRSVVVVDGKSWFLGDFQRFRAGTLYVDPTTNEFETCALTVRTYVPFTLLTSDAFTRPQRARATVTIWSLTNVCGGADGTGCVVAGTPVVEVCDPHAPANATLACSSRNYCRHDWITNGSIIPSFFQQVVGSGPNYADSNAFTEFEQVRRCIAKQVWSVFDESDAEFAEELAVDVPHAGSTMSCARGRKVYVDNIQHTRFGDLNCNDPYHRFIDRGLWLLRRDSGDYPGLCIDQPIGPYSHVLGWMYGVFKDMIADLSFDIPEEDWEDEHYYFLSSTVNDKLWFDVRTNKSVSLITPRVLDACNMELVNQTLQDGFVFNGSVFNTLDPNPGNHANQFKNMLYPFINFDFIDQRDDMYTELGSFDTPFASRDFTAAYYDWFMDVVINSVPNTTKSENFLIMAQSYFKFKRPGFVQGLGGFNMKAVTRIQITFQRYMAAMQFWTDDGDLCATFYNVVPGQVAVFDCQALSTNPGSVNPYEYQIAEGLNITQLVAEIMNPSQVYPPLTEEALNIFRGNLNVTLDPGSTVSELFAAELAFVLGVKFAGHWQGPKVHIVPHSFYSIAPSINASFRASPRAYRYSTELFGPFAFPTQQGGDTFYNSSFLGPEFVVELNSESYNARWSNITQAYAVDHRAPFCQAMDDVYEREPNLYSVPVDVHNAAHRRILRDKHFTHYAPRKCTNDRECRAHSRRGGTTCIYNSYDHVPWRNGDPAIQTTSVGDEGGCAPFQRFDLGYSDGQLLNEYCMEGLGPRNSEEWRSSAVDYQNRLNTVAATQNALFPAGEDPFAAVSAAGTGDEQLDLVNTTLACRLPWDVTAQGKLCAGHGTVSISSNRTDGTLFVHTNRRGEQSTPACTGVRMEWEDRTETLWANNVTLIDPAFQGFQSGNTTLFVVGDELFYRYHGGSPVAMVRGSSCDRLASDALPFVCDYVGVADSTLTATVSCLHTALYDELRSVDVYLGARLLKTLPAHASSWIRRVK